MGIFKKINFGLTKTRNKMAGAIDDMLDSFDEITEDLYIELEEILVMGDVGVTTAVEIAAPLSPKISQKITVATDDAAVLTKLLHISMVERTSSNFSTIPFAHFTSIEGEELDYIFKTKIQLQFT